MRGATRLQTTAGSAAQQHAVCGITMRGVQADTPSERATDRRRYFQAQSVPSARPSMVHHIACVCQRETHETEMERVRRAALVASPGASGPG